MTLGVELVGIRDTPKRAPKDGHHERSHIKLWG